MKTLLLVSCVLFSFAVTGCETVHKAGNATGKAVGETMDAVGSVTEGGAEAVQGKVTDEENPYNR